MRIILTGIIFLFIAGCNSGDSDTIEMVLPTSSDTLDSTRQNLPTSITGHAKMFDGNDIRATGNEPFWMLELTRDSVVFRLIDMQEYRQLLPTPTVDTEDSVRYRVHTVDNMMDILITNKPCVDDMSGFQKRFTTTVHMKRQTTDITYHGCADYLKEYDRVMENKPPR